AELRRAVNNLLQYKGSVQSFEGEDHRLRKAAFLSLMHAVAMSRIGEMFEEEWTGMLESMPGPRRIILHGFAREVLTRTACRWAGVPAGVTDARALSSELGMMIDNVAKVGPANWLAQLRRRGTERWAAG